MFTGCLGNKEEATSTAKFQSIVEDMASAGQKRAANDIIDGLYAEIDGEWVFYDVMYLAGLDGAAIQAIITELEGADAAFFALTGTAFNYDNLASYTGPESFDESTLDYISENTVVTVVSTGEVKQADGDDAAADKTVTSVAAIADINVANGTAIGAAGLPATVSITLSDTSTADVAVAWDGGTPAYDAATAGTYVFAGTITEPAGVADTALTATVNVIVAAAATELTVETAEATNMTTIVVTFSTTVDTLATANFSLSKGTVQTVAQSAVDGKTEAILSVNGLTYGDTVVVTATGVTKGSETLADTDKTTTVPEPNELYEVVVTCDDADANILSDGATKTMLTAYIQDKATKTKVVTYGTVQFATTKGGLAQSEVSFEEGDATVQLTSAASDSTVTATVTATVKSVPGATYYEGLTTSFQVVFSPDAGSAGGSVNYVTLVSAEANQGDRIFVTFSDTISATALKAQIVKDSAANEWKNVATNEFGFQVNGQNVNLSDIIQKSDNQLELILNTDTSGSIAPNTTTQINSVWGSASPAYLKDNTTHTLKVPNEIGQLVQDGQVNFIMTDAQKPFAYGVQVTDQLNFKLYCSESMAEDLVETATDPGDNTKFLLDGKVVRLDTAVTDVDVATAKAENKVIVTQLAVGNYDKASGTDTRNYVFFTLDPNFALAEGAHQLQVAEVGDWANLSDPNNQLSTQTYDFAVAPDTSKPTVTLTQQSPEQWLLTFSENVTIKSGKSITDAIKIYTADNGSTPLDYDANGNGDAGEEYTISTIDGEWGTGAFASGAAANNRFFLIEFTNDWTEIYGTDANGVNYFTSTKNPYKVHVEFFQDGLLNEMDKVVLETTLSYDGVSPTIVSAKANDNGTEVYVEMSEPVMLHDAANTANISTDGATNGFTASEQQAAGAGVPVPTYEFVKGDTTIEGQVKANSINQTDKHFTIVPKNGKTLSGGTWTLYIRSISDDIGNTSATVSTQVVVTEQTQSETDTRVMWAAFDNNSTSNTGNDYLYIKFTKEMDPSTAAGVARTTNYVFNGVELPEGSQVYRGIDGVTDNWDGVTIEMPSDDFKPLAGALDYGCVLNIANNFKSATGEMLSGAYEFELEDTASDASAGADKDFVFEAIYDQYAGINVGAAGTRNIIGAIAFDTDNNGKIDELALLIDEAGVNDSLDIAANQKLKVNGTETGAIVGNNSTLSNVDVAALLNAHFGDANETWAQLPALAGATTDDTDDRFFFVKLGSEIDGTSSANIVITNSLGAVIVAKGKVADAAAPVAVKADINDGVNTDFGDLGDTMAITFSETIFTDADYSGASSIALSSLVAITDVTPTAYASTGTGEQMNGNYSVNGTSSITFTVTTGAGTAIQTGDVPLTINSLVSAVIEDAYGNDLAARGAALSTANNGEIAIQ